MSLSTSRLAYIDCFTLLDRAVAEPRGIRAEVPSLSAATHLRMRIHQARQIDRGENAKTYPADHPLHGRSPYDIFVCRIEEASDTVWLYLDREHVQIGAIESIPEGYQIEAPKPVLRIEYKPEPAAEPAKVGLQIRRR